MKHGHHEQICVFSDDPYFVLPLFGFPVDDGDVVSFPTPLGPTGFSSIVLILTTFLFSAFTYTTVRLVSDEKRIANS
jgi:hypothetical protein